MGSRIDNWRLPSEAYLKLVPNYREDSDDKQMVELMMDAIAHIDTVHSKDPATLLRFIRARGDVSGAAKQFADMVQWRKDNLIDYIDEENLHPFYLHHHYTVEGDGKSFVYICATVLDVDHLLSVFFCVRVDHLYKLLCVQLVRQKVDSPFTMLIYAWKTSKED